jgi:streptogramin lyase
MRRDRGSPPALLAALLSLAACSGEPPFPAPRQPVEPPRSSDYIAALPEGEMRRKIVLGCTPCHQLGTLPTRKKTLEEWRVAITRMKQIDDSLDLALIPMGVEEVAQWLHARARTPEKGFAIETAPADYREYPAGPQTGFYHDMALAGGRAWLADYFGNKLYGIDPETGAVETFDLPVTVAPGKPAGAHQIDVTRDGVLWITFTKSEQVIRFDTAKKEFKVYSGFERGGNVQYFVVDADRNLYQDEGGGIWMTHFSREILSRLDPKTGEIRAYRTPRTEHMVEKGVHLYAAVADSKGRLWYTETHGNRLGMLDPKTGKAFEMDMPEKWVGPKRLAIDKDDVLWIPELATGKISVYDTRRRQFVDRLTLPIPGDFPYGMRRNPRTGDLWITGSGSDSLYRLDPRTKTFRIYRLPRVGAYTRTIAFADNGDIWTNYAAFPNTHTEMPHEAGVAVRLRPR